MALVWLKGKFGLDADVAKLKGREPASVVASLVQLAKEAYENKEALYPVMGGLQTFSRPVGPNHLQVDREGLANWAANRFNSPELADLILTDSGEKVFEELVRVNREMIARSTTTIQETTALLDDTFKGLGKDKNVKNARKSNATELEKLLSWAETELKAKFELDDLLSWDSKDLEMRLRRAIDDKYYPEIRRMERSILLSIVDESWKNHLLAMDHLRSAVGLKGYAQIDPKVEYKREGMRLFDQMWFSIGDRMTDLIFRVEGLDTGAVRQTMVETSARHDEAPRIQAQKVQLNKDQEAQQAAIDQSDEPVKVDPIRNQAGRAGRNDPCPCGSGKKYKNCCLKNESVA